MSGLDVTRTVERWVHREARRRLWAELTTLGASLVVAVCASAVVLTWLPSLAWLVVVAALAVLGMAARAWWRLRTPPTVDEVAVRVDAEGGTAELVRTALAVEGRRAIGGEQAQAVVLDRTLVALPQLEAVGDPPFEVPLTPIVGASAAVVVAVLAIALALVLPSGEDPFLRPMDPSGSAFTREQVAELGAAADALEALAVEPGLTPEAKALAQQARDRLRQALSASGDLRQASAELDRARQALERLDRTELRSSEALRAARPEAIATGLDSALERGDLALARALGEEVLRRTDSAPDAEIRRLGSALAEKVDDRSQAGHHARQAGEALQAGERGGALSALADLMASLGEAARYEPRAPEVDQAVRAVEQARDEALARLDEATSEPGGRRRSQEKVDAPATEAGEGENPAPVDVQQGGEGDGGGGGGEGGDQDLREGGTPTAGGEPEVRTSGERPEGARQEGPDAGDGRTVAGEGEARDGSVDADAPGGRGGGPGPEGGSEPVQGEGGTAAVVAGAGPPGATTGSDLPAGADSLAPIDPSTIAEEWVEAQWSGAGETMGDLLRTADAGGRSGMAWGEVHARYRDLAESTARREALPLTRRTYVRRYFEAIRTPPEPADTESR